MIQGFIFFKDTQEEIWTFMQYWQTSSEMQIWLTYDKELLIVKIT